MIALIIVSHSRRLAQGVQELAEQMAIDALPIAAVGGLWDEETGAWMLGTDAVRIADAIQTSWQPDGALILADLGSAILSAELALEMLPSAMAEKCLISNAPLVEGTVIAAIEAGFDKSLVDVNQAAEEALLLDKVTRSRA